MKMSRHVSSTAPNKVVMELTDREHALFRELMEVHISEESIIDNWVDNLKLFVEDNDGELPEDIKYMTQCLVETIDMVRDMTRKMS